MSIVGKYARAFRLLRYVVDVLQAKVWNVRKPLIVSWILTSRCNFSCPYCHSVGDLSKELSTAQVFNFVRELARLGTRRISFTGGEPLMRDDLGEIVDYCVENGMVVTLNSNGSMVSSRIRDIRRISLLTLSLDGPEDVHDAIRGKGAFAGLMDAIACARQERVRVYFATTLSSPNLSYLGAIFEISRMFGIKVFFQPAEHFQLRDGRPNPIAPARDEYAKAMVIIMEEKKRNPLVGNSWAGLKHLFYWPRAHPLLKCYGGLLSVRIDANGDIKICGRPKGDSVLGNVLTGDFERIFMTADLPVCRFCWCSSRIEFNKAMALDIDAVSNIFMAA